jgi:hypothetical protein
LWRGSEAPDKLLQGGSAEKRFGWKRVRSSSFREDGDEIFLLGDGDYAVTAHDGADGYQVWLMVVAEEYGDFEEILGAHDAGGLEAEDAGGGVGEIGKEVGRATGYEEGGAATDLSGLVEESPGHGAINAEDGLIVFAMKVGKGDASERGNGDFEEIENTTGFVAGLEEGDAHLADADRVVHSHLQ